MHRIQGGRVMIIIQISEWILNFLTFSLAFVMLMLSLVLLPLVIDNVIAYVSKKR